MLARVGLEIAWVEAAARQTSEVVADWRLARTMLLRRAVEVGTRSIVVLVLVFSRLRGQRGGIGVYRWCKGVEMGLNGKLRTKSSLF